MTNNQQNSKWKESLPVDSIIVETGITAALPDIITSLNTGKKFTIVSDSNTHAVLGRKIEKALGKNAISFILSGVPKADEKTVEKIRVAAKASDAVIAVGSGTINDLCKYASFLDNKPYMVFGTAPSMNGYSSANAAITVGGHKKTLAAHLPKGIFLDLDVLAEAPLRLIRSGLGDSICRPTAQSDWLLSHLLLGTKYDDKPFVMLKEYEQGLFDNSKALVNGDREILKLLANTLLASGAGMYICGGSYPASQGEHMIAHTMEIMHGDDLPQSYHGEHIAVTTLTMADIQRKILDSRPVIKDTILYKEDILAYFGEEIGSHSISEYEKKRITGKKLDELNAKIGREWDDIREKIEKIATQRKILEKILRNADSPVVPEDIGWGRAQYDMAVKNAKYMRDRFTFLDMV